MKKMSFWDKEYSEQSFSYGDDESAGESEAAGEQENAAGEAQATGDQWDGFRYEDLGLTQWEFQQAKEEGLTRDKLTRLVELGVRISEYFQKPWNKLGVSEEDWLAQRSEGLEHADLLVRQDICCIHQITRNGNRAFVIEVRVGNGSAVNFRF